MDLASSHNLHQSKVITPSSSDNVQGYLQASSDRGDDSRPLSVEETLRELNKSLNPEQKIAAESTEGPVMMIAGAGAGKTKTVIHRVATLMVKGVPASNIMVVTFTNRAASEIKERLESMVGENGQYVHAGTFHSIIFREILKPYADSGFLRRNGVNMEECAILDDKDAQSLLKDAVNDLSEQDARAFDESDWKISNIENEMSSFRAKGLGVSDYHASIVPNSKNEIMMRIVVSVWQKYSKKCREANGMDFDDILVFADKMLKAEPHITNELSRKFRYIMLDEYQDTNPVQMSIMDSIAQHHQNICTVGDEKQSIYKFRGAEVKVILTFKDRFKNARLVDMNKNYRSYDSIIKYSNALADAMTQRLSDGQLVPQRKIEEEPDLVRKRKSNSVAMVEFSDERKEAEVVLRAIMRDISMGVRGEDIAVLYRNRGLKNELERALVDLNVPYKIYGDRSFFQKAEVRDAVALIRFVFNPWDSVAGFRVIKATSMRVSDVAAKKAMRDEGINVHEFLNQQSTKRLKTKRKDQELPDLTASAVRIAPFVAIAKMLKESAEYGDSPTFIRDAIARLWDIYMRPSIESKLSAGKSSESEDQVDGRVKNVTHIFKKLKESLEAGNDIQTVIEDLQMMVENNIDNDAADESKVQLMTMHASKGLEFHNVYIIGMDNVTTHGNENESDDIEESRRLMYVGMTRAEKKLTMSYSTRRMHNGKYIETHGSPFFDEIEERTNARRFVFEGESAPSYSR